MVVFFLTISLVFICISKKVRPYTNQKIWDDLQTSEVEYKDVKRITVVLIRGTDAEKIKKLLDNETRVFVEIEEGQKVVETVKVQRSSVLFVSVSFIVLMIISLAWLVFYYIQRFRYAQARDRTQRRLSKAAKKALLKLPVKSVKEDDAETKGNICSVCLELYKLGEAIRVLPCRFSQNENQTLEARNN
ncbi:hypothetical protein BSL78_24525 [Apostichopus japonicus]|uniref:Uncharacterized protein n=1 Tax=Stichopus japonicus TaxID=307972 RepID=A0A2G8JS87_STIJA|nr:hypothetical protein BSL78_24525 [Apostichopus japonicus]